MWYLAVDFNIASIEISSLFLLFHCFTISNTRTGCLKARDVPDFGSGSGNRLFFGNPALARILTGFGAAVPFGNMFNNS